MYFVNTIPSLKHANAMHMMASPTSLHRRAAMSSFREGKHVYMFVSVQTSCDELICYDTRQETTAAEC